MAISRVIEVSFGRSSVALVRIDTAYFYNNGIIFKPTDIDLPASYQVHWADNPQASSTLETIGTAEGAPIPDDLWNRSRVIYGWIYLHPTEDSGITYKEVRIYKNVRAGLPDGTEPTPAEQSTIDQLIGALNSAVEQTGEDVESAEQAKDDAESARDNAQTYANNAQSSAQASARSAESASQSARTASEKATASAQSASQSAQIKADVEGMVDDAQSYAESALIASQASVTARNTAQGYAQSASVSAQSASTSASDALTYANTASSKASEASTSAQTASAKATESAQSASQALSYKTDAESAKTASQTAQGLAESARDSAISAKNDAESARDDAETARDEAQSAVASISGALAEKAPIITDTASGSIASFSDGADDLPLKSLVVDINPVQDLSHGDPSPENICPISGWTEINAYNDPLHGGNIEWNQLVNSYRSGSTNGLTFVPDANDKSISISGTITTAFSYDTIAFTSSSPVKIKRDGRRYIFICNQATPYPIRVAGFADCVSVGSYGGVFSNYTSGNQEFTNTLAFHAIEGDTFAVSNFTVQMFDLTTMFGAEIADYIYSLEQANAGAGVAWFKKLFPKDYYEYNAGEKTTVSAVNEKPYTHVNIQLGQTVYGGKLDVLSGVLTVDRAMVDLGTLNWVINGTDSVYTTELTNKLSGGDNCICSALVKVAQGTAVHSMPDASFKTYADSVYVAVKLSGITIGTAATMLSGFMFCYPLATPIEIQLSPNQVNSLLGVNNIWADSGDTEVEYRADTKLFIERLTAPDSADMIADANITSGKYFMVGNSLYKATANIANGSAIIVGTNAVRKSLSEALNEINA